MTTRIDCSMMSHAACEPVEDPPVTSRTPEPAQSESAHDRCVNDCISSSGTTVLLSGTVVGLGCVVLPLACPVFLGAGAGSLLGACDAGCDELESPE